MIQVQVFNILNVKLFDQSYQNDYPYTVQVNLGSLIGSLGKVVWTYSTPVNVHLETKDLFGVPIEVEEWTDQNTGTMEISLLDMVLLGLGTQEARFTPVNVLSVVKPMMEPSRFLKRERRRLDE